jgi:hypothetical protein
MLSYISKNETSRNISVIFCTDHTRDSHERIQEFTEIIEMFIKARVFPLLNISLVIEGSLEFRPETIKSYAKRFKMQRNNIFIGSLHHTHDFNFEDLGGVRIIQE